MQSQSLYKSNKDLKLKCWSNASQAFDNTPLCGEIPFSFGKVPPSCFQVRLCRAMNVFASMALHYYATSRINKAQLIRCFCLTLAFRRVPPTVSNMSRLTSEGGEGEVGFPLVICPPVTKPFIEVVRSLFSRSFFIKATDVHYYQIPNDAVFFDCLFTPRWSYQRIFLYKTTLDNYILRGFINVDNTRLNPSLTYNMVAKEVANFDKFLGKWETKYSFNFL